MSENSKIECLNYIVAPRIRQGDTIWGRETLKKGHLKNILTGKDIATAETIHYAADNKGLLNSDGFDLAWIWGDRKTQVSIHMPRWASRMILPVLDVRAERVQDISEEDAKNEGVVATIKQKRHGWNPHVLEYCLLWDQINGFGSWDKNPAVWVYDFPFYGGAK